MVTSTSLLPGSISERIEGVFVGHSRRESA